MIRFIKTRIQMWFAGRDEKTERRRERAIKQAGSVAKCNCNCTGMLSNRHQSDCPQRQAFEALFYK